ncbi:hypothetical protein [Kribbella turkmenica]|uniref:hypothetical protein n=1 Tax=Kribbella turkmenica TaxID=2530375 RepID=UPI0014049CDD|nr:hypothetical protein [Kribbella turkmenica]
MSVRPRVIRKHLLSKCRPHPGLGQWQVDGVDVTGAVRCLCAAAMDPHAIAELGEQEGKGPFSWKQ